MSGNAMDGLSSAMRRGGIDMHRQAMKWHSRAVSGTEMAWSGVASNRAERQSKGNATKR